MQCDHLVTAAPEDVVYLSPFVGLFRSGEMEMGHLS